MKNMLTENHIPTAEPDVDVGIVLPDDALAHLELELPSGETFELRTADGTPLRLPGGSQVIVQRGEDRLRLQASSLPALESTACQLVPAKPARIQAGSGIRVKNVIAGRQFHWRKTIDVSLPGEVHLRVHRGQLVLINRVHFEQYLMCVATSEMSAKCPQALIEAQTVAARSWVLANVEHKHRELGMDVCNDDCCQRYQGTTFLSSQAIAGAEATHGLTLLHGDAVCDARYSKSCGGVMEAFESVWPAETPHPYLQVKFDGPASDGGAVPDLRTDPGMSRWVQSQPRAYCSPAVVPENDLLHYLGSVDESGTYFRWQFSQTQAAMTATLRRTLGLPATAIVELQPQARGGSGRITRLRIVYRDDAGREQAHLLESEYAIRAALHDKFLYSSALHIEIEAGDAGLPAQFHFLGCGWGHGVGLCQIGALGMALRGHTSAQILAHYYPGAELRKLY